MSFQTNITNGLNTVAGAVKSLRVTTIGDLSTLTTSAKGSVVAALNEVRALAAGAGTAEIDDLAAGNSTSKTYSANKITQLVAQAKSDLVNGAGAALDTLSELSAALGNDANFATTITAALAKRLRVDAAQSFTSPELAQAQTNLSVYSRAEIGDATHDFVADVNAALA